MLLNWQTLLVLLHSLFYYQYYYHSFYHLLLWSPQKRLQITAAGHNHTQKENPDFTLALKHDWMMSTVSILKDLPNGSRVSSSFNWISFFNVIQFNLRKWESIALCANRQNKMLLQRIFSLGWSVCIFYRAVIFSYDLGGSIVLFTSGHRFENLLAHRGMFLSVFWPLP
jgi:hypothetical protein